MQVDLRREANLIGGAWVGADSGRTLTVDDPASGAVIGVVPDAGRAETARAIAAAAHAFPDWAGRSPFDRAARLTALAGAIRRQTEPLARQLTLEQGKPLAEARTEISAGAAYLDWFAEEARRIPGSLAPSPWGDRRLLVTREPVGVAGAITPWNFPFSMIARKLGACLAAGCTLVLKPSELTPFSGLAWGVLATEIGLPDGVINIVTGDAAAIGAELTENPLVRKITFTGSTRVGKLLYAQSAGTMKRLSLELGGNAPFLVFDDADLDRAVTGAIASKFRNSGQTCVCTNRFYVQETIFDRFAERLVAAVSGLKVGSGLDLSVTQGPLINDAAIAKVEELVADACAKGGRVLLGGRRHALGGRFYEPTVIVGGTPAMRIAEEEVFGPVALLFSFRDEAEAIAAANDTAYGLAAYVYTRDLARAFRVPAALRCGMVGINEGIITTEAAPFGGVKESGFGREGGSDGLADYLDVKYLSLGGVAAT